MNIFIDNKSGVPIYDQIYSQIKTQIISRELPEDYPLPSIRSLAKDLRISVVTTKRAYEELEREGFIYTIPAKGCFVAQNNLALIHEEHLKQIEGHIDSIVRLSKICSISQTDIFDMIKFAMEDKK